MAALIAGAVTPDGPPASFLLPLHQHDLLRRCLAAGLRIVKPMNYMVDGPLPPSPGRLDPIRPLLSHPTTRKDTS